MIKLLISEQNDPAEWENWPHQLQDGVFLQSWNSRRLHQSLGNKTWALQMHEGKKKVGQALVIKIPAKRGTFLYSPYGPTLSEWKKEYLQEWTQALTRLGMQEGANFIRISPFIHESPENQELFRSSGFKKAPMHMLAETLWLLPLKNKSEETLLAGMEKKHRNLIRRAKKEGVEVIFDNSEKAIRQFFEKYLETVSRHKFTPYPKEYIRNQIRLYEEDSQAVVLSANYKGKTLASAVIMYYGKGAAYHHGASSSDPQFRKIPASYLLQWEAIKEAKKRNCHFYNFWGIAPYTQSESGHKVYENKNHPFVGITHFKSGFGGKRKDLLPCQDLPLNKKYYFNWLIESVRKWRRGF